MGGGYIAPGKLEPFCCCSSIQMAPHSGAARAGLGERWQPVGQTGRGEGRRAGGDVDAHRKTINCWSTFFRNVDPVFKAGEFDVD
jgi:hypothetical protein